jgi:hypothetical protein
MAIPSRRRRRGRAVAVRAKKPSRYELQRVVPESVEVPRDPNEPFVVRMEWDDVRETAAKLYGRGYKRAAIARALMEQLYPENGVARTPEQKMSSCMHKLRRWEYSQEFRDLVYKYAVVELDMDSPRILTALSKRAQRGRVDAARLALELTGRHTKDSGAEAVNVTVNLANVARPDK